MLEVLGQLTAVVAEDAHIMSRLLRAYLMTYNCHVVAEISAGDRVIAAIEQHKPNIVFLDINLPKRNGLDVLHEIKTRWPDLFTVMFSAHNTVDNVQKSVNWGADGFIVKPFSTIKVKEAIDNYIARQAPAKCISE